jgi:hypothetical protein
LEFRRRGDTALIPLRGLAIMGRRLARRIV